MKCLKTPENLIISVMTEDEARTLMESINRSIEDHEPRTPFEHKLNGALYLLLECNKTEVEVEDYILRSKN